MGPCPDGDLNWIAQSFEGKELFFEADTLKFPRLHLNNQGRFVSSRSSDGDHDYHEDHSKAGWDEDEYCDHSFNEIFSIVFGSFSIIERYLAVGPDGVRLPSSYF